MYGVRNSDGPTLCFTETKWYFTQTKCGCGLSAAKSLLRGAQPGQ